MARLNGKLMEDKLKVFWVVSDFAKLFNITEDEFIENLKREFAPKEANKMIVRLKKNQKIKEKRENSIRRKTEKDCNQDVIENDKDESSENLELESLKEQLNDLSDFIVTKEKERLEILSSKNAIKEELRKEQEELIKIKKEVEEKSRKIDSIIVTIAAINEKIGNINYEIQKCNIEFEELKAKIEDLEKITIYAFEDGTIEAEDIDIDSIEWQSEYSRITQDASISDLTEPLTIKQCKQLAKLFALKNQLKDKNFEVIFDSQMLQKAFMNN